MMTTAVNLGRPYRLPFSDPDRIFYFCPDDFRTLFPERVVQHMVDTAPSRDGKAPRTADGKLLVPFPGLEQLPVVVATRMSLSFPILLSAVPLYAVDFTRLSNQRLQPDEAPVAERCWFSDGGETSNLPIHFFDGPVPEWPTFAISLKQFHPDYPDEKDAVCLPSRNDSGWLPHWIRFEKPGKFASPLAFLGAIASTVYNWQDNALSHAPGYRDRIVSVCLHENEGGYNLNMDAATVNRLSDRGRPAADALIEQFHNGDGWANHVWLRFRSCAHLTARWLRALPLRAAAPGQGRSGEVASAIAAWIEGGAPSYPVPAATRTDFRAGVNAIFGAASQIGDEVLDALETNAPRPYPELRIRPKV
ncbi:MAG: hypothetical protein JO336_07705 [Acidobacteriia bacterium]|nr:hypothetical protein [Terriglobia bacterium]